MLALKLVLLLVLIATNLAGPGLLLLRKVRWSPGEKFCASIALSQFIAFLLSFAIYILHLSNGWYWSVTLVGAASLIVVRRELVRLLQNHHVRAQLKAYAWLFVVSFCMLAMIRHYSGGVWAGDWFEHYQRAIFFLDHHPPSQLFLDQYTLPARPPMMNVLAAAYLAQIGEHGFAAFSVIFLLLNLLVVLPCVLLLPMLALRRTRMARKVLLFLLATSPVLLQNATWTWTKLFAAFYVLVALRMYLLGWRRLQSARIVTAFVLLAMGALVHYSVGPYIVALGVHYVLQFLRRRAKNWREPILAMAGGAIVLATWFAWSIHTYGVHETFSSNTSVALAAASNESAASRIAGNLSDSIVPVLWRDPTSFNANFAQASRQGAWHDYTFSLYQHNLILGMGSLAGAVIAVMVGRLLLGRQLPRRVVVFWRWFIFAVVYLGIAVEGMREPLGCAHLCLQALMLLGLVFLATRWAGLNHVLRGLLIAGALVDYALGIWLHEHIEHLDYASAAALNHRALDSYNAKRMYGLVFLGDYLAKASFLFLVVQIVCVAWLALCVAKTSLRRRAGEGNPARLAPH